MGNGKWIIENGKLVTQLLYVRIPPLVKGNTLTFIMALGLTLITSSAMAEEKSLCKFGTVANLVQSGTTWTWTCEGIHGGKSKSCAPKINGACGSANGVATAGAPTDARCSAGVSSSITTNISTYTWSCNGINGGSNAGCSCCGTPTCR
ncbi:MAG: hypothetical protein FWF23_01385 [Alphaproteobacteria bacterium]|nr:hypothetical protein [Alphaproteobacteria bacterium]MCL2505413.1 hypothetical protein [Alphaproteobacteria bacterium]